MKEESNNEIVCGKVLCVETIRQALISKFMEKEEYTREEIAEVIEELFMEI